MPADKPGRSSAEYLKQLFLTSALAVCRHLSPDNRPLPADRLAQDQFNVELVVKCIRTSEDAHTHRQGLLLLATAAGLFPVSLAGDICGGDKREKEKHVIRSAKIWPLSQAIPLCVIG